MNGREEVDYPLPLLIHQGEITQKTESTEGRGVLWSIQQILRPSPPHSSHRRKRSSSEEPVVSALLAEERASRKSILHRRVSFQNSPTRIRRSVYNLPEYSPTRRLSPPKRVSFSNSDIEFEMLSPAMLKMSIKRSSMSNATGVPYMPSSHGFEGGSASFPRISEEQYLTQRRGSGTSNLSFPSDSEDIHSIVRNGILEEERSMHRHPSMGNKRRTSISLDRSNSTKGGRRGTIQMVELSSQIQPHQYTTDPTVAWEMLKAKRPVKKVIQMKRDAPVKAEAVRFVCLGCTHGEFPKEVPQGDILVITGDFTTCGLPKEVKAFNSWLGQQKHAYKVIIAGNHECTFDEQFLKTNTSVTDPKEIALKQALVASIASNKLTTPKPLITNAIYLQDSLIELFGITIYGTPWQPKIDNWAFNLPRGTNLLEKWNQIPSGVDVLITHTPPLGHGDTLKNGQRVGCVELLNSVTKRIKPKYHVFSHIHEGYGCTSDGYTKFINCSMCDENLQLANAPVIFDIPVHPHTKQHYLNNVKKVMKRFTKEKK